MAIKKAKKKEILEKVSDIAKNATSTVFVNFHGMSVGRITEVRRQLREAGVSYMVSKKTLARKAFSERGFKGEMPTLDGELAIAYSTAGKPGSDESLVPAREIHGFEKKFDGKISILGGVFEDAYKSKEEMQVIASIPPRQMLYGMFVNLINSPIQRLAIAVSEIAKTKTV